MRSSTSGPFRAPGYTRIGAVRSPATVSMACRDWPISARCAGATWGEGKLSKKRRCVGDVPWKEKLIGELFSRGPQTCFQPQSEAPSSPQTAWLHSPKRDVVLKLAHPRSPIESSVRFKIRGWESSKLRHNFSPFLLLPQLFAQETITTL